MQMWVQMGKKSIYYGSVCSLSFRCLIGGNFGYVKKRKKRAMSTSQKVFFKNIFGNPVCCVLRTRKLRSKFVGSIICEANYPEGARTARIGEANQASECNGELYFVLPPEQNQHGARGMKRLLLRLRSSIFHFLWNAFSFRFIPFFFIFWRGGHDLPRQRRQALERPYISCCHLQTTPQKRSEI